MADTARAEEMQATSAEAVDGSSLNFACSWPAAAVGIAQVLVVRATSAGIADSSSSSLAWPLLAAVVGIAQAVPAKSAEVAEDSSTSFARY